MLPVVGNFWSKSVAMLYPFVQQAREMGPFVHKGSEVSVVFVPARFSTPAGTTAPSTSETDAARHTLAPLRKFIPPVRQGQWAGRGDMVRRKD